MSGSNDKIVITIEPNEDTGELYARAAYDFGKGLQSHALTHEYVIKADTLAQMKLKIGSSVEGIVFQKVPDSDYIRSYYLNSKPGEEAILNFISAISQVSTQVGLKVFVSNGEHVVLANRNELKLMRKIELTDDDIKEEQINRKLLKEMASVKSSLVKTNKLR